MGIRGVLWLLLHGSDKAKCWQHDMWTPPEVVSNGVKLVHVLFLAHGEGLLPQVRPHHVQRNQHLAGYVAPDYGQICTP